MADFQFFRNFIFTNASSKSSALQWIVHFLRGQISRMINIRKIRRIYVPRKNQLCGVRNQAESSLYSKLPAYIAIMYKTGLINILVHWHNYIVLWYFHNIVIFWYIDMYDMYISLSHITICTNYIHTLIT